MIIAIWDYFFTRRVWTTVREISLLEDDNATIPIGRVYILQDQFGNIKKKKVRF